MRRLLIAGIPAFLFTLVSGCGESQPNAPVAPAEVNADAGKSAMDQMKNANSGMNPKDVNKKK